MVVPDRSSKSLLSQAGRRAVKRLLSLAAERAVMSAAAVGLMATMPAFAQTAPPAAERCEGTLCDLYYSSRPAAGGAVASPAATPSSGGLMNWFSRGPGPANAAPTEPPSATNSYMALGAGGILGPKQERCTGTICDLYYGSSQTPEAAGKQGASAASVAANTAASPQVPHRHIVHESETRPKCSSPAADPWRCFR